MIPISPFKFLDSYTEEDRDIFFGRDQEIEEVYKKIFQGKTLFIYGESGTGKSSLVHCGLANRFKDSDWLPIYVRRGQNIKNSLLQELDKLTLTKVKQLNGSFSRNLYQYTRSIYLDYFKPVYFIFDQFEELYLLGTRSEWKEFIEGIQHLVQGDINAHFIFIIRSEYLHFLSEFEESLPEVFNNKMRVEKITRVMARDCIEGPCKVFGIPIENGFTERLFDQLSPDSIEVELTYLQVYLDRIFRMALVRDSEKIAFTNELLDEIGLVSDVLSDFLDAQIEAMEKTEETLSVLKGFVTIEGTKKQVTIGHILSFSKSIGHTMDEELATSIISELLERRIIKELPQEGQFELRHDALAFKIFEKITTREKELIEIRQFLDYGFTEYRKRGFLLNDKDLAYVEPHLAALDLPAPMQEFVHTSANAIGKKRRVRNRIIGTIITILALSITSIYGFFDARLQRKEALVQKELADENAREAQEQRQIAEQNATLAFEAQQEAEKNAEDAQEQRQSAERNAEDAARQAEIASQQRIIAELQRNAADSNRLEAENQRLLALTQKDNAETARAQALKYLEEANRERANAQRLSMQTLARSLGIKSAQLSDLTLKSLIALQAYQFNNLNDGYQYQADIHSALYLARKAYLGPDFNSYKGHSAAVNEISVANNRVYSASSDGTVLEWKENLSENRSLFSTREINYCLALSADDQYLAIGTASGKIYGYNLKTGDLIPPIMAHQGRIWDMEFNSEDQLVSSGEDRNIVLLELDRGQMSILLSFETPAKSIGIRPKDNVLFLGFEAGRVLAVSNPYDLSVTLKSIDSLRDKLVLQGNIGPAEDVIEIAFHPSGEIVAMGYENGSILLLDWSEMQTNSFDPQTLPGHTARVADIKFSEDGKFLATAGYDRKNLLYNMENLKEPPIIWSDHESFVLTTAFSPAGEALITGEINNVTRKYMIEMDSYAQGMCEQVDRNFTEQEWQNFMRDDVPYQRTCKN